MKVVMLTRDKTHVEYLFENLTIYKIQDREIFCNGGTLVVDRFIVVEDTVEVKRDDEITEELLLLDKTKDFVFQEITVEEQVKALELKNQQLEEEKKLLEGRTQSLEMTMLDIMDMYTQSLKNGIDLS